jgi:K+-sensing histidine kinase KdpD
MARLIKKSRDCRPGLASGLYITQNILKAHGSKLTVKSQSGKGTTFSFALSGSTQVEKLMKSRFLLKAPYLAGAVNKQIRPFE